MTQIDTLKTINQELTENNKYYKEDNDRQTDESMHKQQMLDEWVVKHNHYVTESTRELNTCKNELEH